MENQAATTAGIQINIYSGDAVHVTQTENGTSVSTLKPLTQSTATPQIGQAWPGQGGVYAGIVRDGNCQWHLILATAAAAKIKAVWGESENEIPGDFSRRDGQHNTQLIVDAEPGNEIAALFQGLTIEGHTDFYWPAELEQNLIALNLPEHVESCRHWSSTQFSASYAWIQDFGDGRQYVDNKHHTLAARAVRRILIIE